MNYKPESWDIRRDEIRQRLGSLHARLDELHVMLHDDRSMATHREQAEAAQCNLAAAQAAAGQAIAASIRAFRRAAKAHEHAALRYERITTGGSNDRDRYEQQAAIHRAAQAVDTQRAEHAQLLALDQQMHEWDSGGLDRAWARFPDGS